MGVHLVHFLDSLSDSVSVISGWPMFGLDSGQRGTRGGVEECELETDKWGNADSRKIGVAG